MNQKEKLQLGQQLWDEVVPKTLHLEDPAYDGRYVAVSTRVKTDTEMLKDVIRIIKNNYFIPVDMMDIAATIVVANDADRSSISRKNAAHAQVVTYPEFVGASDD
jgi:hypothetical protein